MPETEVWNWNQQLNSMYVTQALKDLVRKHGNGNFPLLLVFYRRKCVRVRSAIV